MQQQQHAQHAQQGHAWQANSRGGGSKGSDAAADGNHGGHLPSSGDALGQEDSAFCKGSSPAPGAAAAASAADSSSSSSGSHGRAGTKACPAGIALAEAIVGTEGAVLLLIEKALAYATLCHLKWTLWGLIQVRLMSGCGKWPVLAVSLLTMRPLF